MKWLSKILPAASLALVLALGLALGAVPATAQQQPPQAPVLKPASPGALPMGCRSAVAKHETFLVLHSSSPVLCQRFLHRNPARKLTLLKRRQLWLWDRRYSQNHYIGVGW